MSTANDDFDLDYADGVVQGEMFVTDLREALRDGRVEVKLDRGFIDTGNIYVETECLKKGRWVPTGIANSDTAALWVYVLRGTGLSVVFDIQTLRRLAHYPQMSRASEHRTGGNPTVGRLLNLSAAFRRGALR